MAAIQVLSAGAVRVGLTDLAAEFGNKNNCEVDVTFSTGPEIRERLTADGAGNDDLDLVVAPKALMDDLVAAGCVDASTRFTLGGVKAAVAVKTGAPMPDISSADSLRAAILAAEVIVYNKASSGQYIDQMIAGLGIADDVEAKIQRFPDACIAMTFLGKMESDGGLGFGQSSAIRGYAPLGVTQVGPLPDAVGNVTTYDAAVAVATANRETTDGLLGYLTSEYGLAAFTATGVE
ncbi:MAG: substrate-binding domain-containing protein [Alphaproteobacteria bacterium]|jgi:molybdate transport system substrate-binding protein